MRITGLGALTMGMLLLNADGEEESATRILSLALKSGCEPWLCGRSPDSVRGSLMREGWGGGESGVFTRDGEWGEVTLTLCGFVDEAALRACTVRVLTEQVPWTVSTLASAAQAWIAGRFADSLRERSLVAIVDGHAARVTTWSSAAANISITAFRSKQAQPGCDFKLAIEQV